MACYVCGCETGATISPSGGMNKGDRFHRDRNGCIAALGKRIAKLEKLLAEK